MALALGLLVGCGPTPKGAPVVLEKKVSDPTVVEATMRDFTAFFHAPNLGGMVVLGNGQIGFGLCPVSGEDDASSWQTLMIAGEYSSERPASLLRFTNPIFIECLVGDDRPELLSPTPDAVLTLDFKSGVYRATWKQGAYGVNWSFVVNPNRKEAVEQLEVNGPPGVKVDVRKGLPEEFRATNADFRGSPSCDVRYQTVDRYATGFPDHFGQDGAFVVERYHRFAGALEGTTRTFPEWFDDTERRSKSVLSGPEAPMIVVDGPTDDQQFVNSALFHLRTNVNPNGPTGPFGLTNSKYGGRVFWDSDIWMFPALALLDPGRAKSIPEFRYKSLDAAYRSQNNRPFALGSQARSKGARFPWESGPNGEEMATGDSKHELHVTGSVAWSVDQAGALGLLDSIKADALVTQAALYYEHAIEKNSDGSSGMKRVMSPDEFAASVDNDLYTNILAEWCINKKLVWPRQTRLSLKRPRDSTTFLTYDGDGLKAYKQAAALLAIWPLQDPACEKEATQMLDRFAGKTTPNGPAMSKSVEALIRARFGDKEQAYRDWRESWRKYTQRPMLMFSEAPNGKNAYFLTGAAGCLDAFLYGFVGLRIDDEDPGQKPWKAPLKNGCWLSCEPHLPTAWKSVTIDPLVVLGKKYRLTVRGSSVKVTPH